MKRLTSSAILLTAVLWTSCTCLREQSTSATVDLFNGQDLTGWRAVLAKPDVKIDAVWSVRDGMIVCKGEPLGFIETAQTYRNFKLAVEWRWAPGKEPGNSGVFLRINGVRKPLPRCIECQLRSGDAGDFYAFHGMKIDGKPERRVEVKNHELGGDFLGVKKQFPNEKPPGEWNHLEIVADGPNVTVWVNRKQVNEASGCEDVAGPVGLQSEGGEIHFRSVRLTPLGK
jgi:hypothetical protein